MEMVEVDQDESLRRHVSYPANCFAKVDSLPTFAEPIVFVEQDSEEVPIACLKYLF
jgi:hypothetical protein